MKVRYGLSASKNQELNFIWLNSVKFTWHKPKLEITIGGGGQCQISHELNYP